jgi:hypothetical protein
VAVFTDCTENRKLEVEYSRILSLVYIAVIISVTYRM